jgi:hypothetical protein
LLHLVESADCDHQAAKGKIAVEKSRRQPSDELLKRKIDLAFVPSEYPPEPSRTDAASSFTPTLCPTRR